MLKNLYFDTRTFKRNEALAHHLGIPYSAETHKAYKRNLRDIGAPVKSVLQVVLGDVYDRRLAGSSAYPLSQKAFVMSAVPDRDEEQALQNVRDKVLRLSRQNKELTQLREMVSPYVAAFAKATNREVALNVEAMVVQEEVSACGKGGTFYVQGRPKAEISHRSETFNPKWHWPQKNGWRP